MEEEGGDLAKKLLSQLSDHITKVIEQRSDRSTETVDFIYLASRARILTAADKLMRNELSSDVSYMKECSDEIPIPKQEKWDLKMGDSVIVKYSQAEFKSISRRTVGWKPRYAKILTHIGIVTSICSAYDCHVQVLFPDLPMMTEIYAGLLSRTTEKPESNRFSRFQPQDRVVVAAPKKLMQLLQRGYETLPESFLNKIGTVIAVDCENAVYVTFTGTFTTKVNPALLQKTEGKLEIAIFPNAKGIAPDDKVFVTRNLKTLVEAQKKIHEWERWMSRLPGKALRVLLVKKDGLLRVCDDAARSFNIHTDMVSTAPEVTDAGTEDGESLFEVEEWVAIRKISNLKQILEQKKIPYTLLEFLQHPAMVMSYDSDLDPGISFDSIYTIAVPVSALEKLTEEEHEMAQQIAAEARDLKAGDEVYLNLGPPNYVGEVLLEQGIADSIIDTMTSPAHLCGFIGTNQAVIKCADGKSRKINKVYLTVPRKFCSPTKDKLCDELALTNAVVAIVGRCLDDIHEKHSSVKLQIGNGIKTVYLGNGEPSTLRLGIRSHFANSGNLLQALESTRDLKFKSLSNDFIRVHEMNSNPSDLLVRFDFEAAASVTMPVARAPSLEQKSEQKAEALGMHVTEPASIPEAVKATPPPRVEPPADDQDARGLNGYQHLEMMLEGKRVLIPYKVADGPQQNPAGARRERREPTGEICNRITIEGAITGVNLQ